MKREQLIYYSFKYQGQWNKIYEAIESNQPWENVTVNNAIVIGDKDYPSSFYDLKCPPFVIYTLGNKDLLQKEAISIVGSRNVCDYGYRASISLCEYLKDKYVLVSGLAKGVDSIVAQVGLEQGYTIGVLGCGINVVYPKSNQRLFERMTSEQLIISEYPNDVPPYAHQFPKRNRLIAALGSALVVTQAAMKSGTMITVNEAIALNKDVYVVPYKMDDENGVGCNYLIQQGAQCIYDLSILP